MSYEPREGVDYVVDLYAVAGVAQEADTEAVKQALNARAREYYPDRLQGLALEFQEKGERMARLLNRARVVLLDTEKRSEYDDILTNWKGPVSKDGTPIIKMDDALRAEMAMRMPEEIEAIFAAQAEEAAGWVKHNPKQQAMLGRMLAAAKGEDADELREAYDAALLAEDQMLALEEAERGRLLGLPERKGFQTTLDYADTVRLAIENARTVQAEEYKRRALGGVGMRLALLAGENAPEPDEAAVVPAAGALPHYFEDQAKRVTELAEKREGLLEKRLEIFQPTYPIAEIQTEAKPDFVIGITDAKGERYSWTGFHFDADTVTLDSIELPEEVTQLLQTGQFEQVYTSGYNVLTFATKDHIELMTLLAEAYNKHLQKYFPEAMGL